MDRVIQGGPIDYSQLHLFLESSLFLCSRRSPDRARPVTARSPMIRPPDGAASFRTGLAQHPGAAGACETRPLAGSSGHCPIPARSGTVIPGA
jgi:hypothetical protein